MGLQLLWSFGLACLDVYALRGKKDLQNPILVSLFVVGDWVCSHLFIVSISDIVFLESFSILAPLLWTQKSFQRIELFCFMERFVCR